MSDVSGQQNIIEIKGTWYYNRRVPRDLITQLGRPLIRETLRTKDKAVAKKRRVIKDLEWDAKFDLARQADGGAEFPSAPNASLAELLRDYVDAQTAELEQRASSPLAVTVRLDVIQEAEETIGILRDPENPELAPWVSKVANTILKQGHAELIEGESRSAFFAMLTRALVEVERRRKALFQGDYSSSHFDKAFGPSEKPKAKFRELANQFQNQRVAEAKANRRSQKSIDKVITAVSLLCELVGEGRLVDEIDYDATQEIRAKIAALPTNRTKIYGNLPVRKAIDLAAKEGRPTLAAHTQGWYIGIFKAIMELGAEKKLISYNPAGKLRSLTQESASARDKRAPWSLEQVIAFFTSTFYLSCAPGSGSPYLNKDRDWRFWLPLVCLFMGMRPNEVCQMLVRDVQQTKNGIWFLDITDISEGGTKTVKTPASRRKMVIHPELIRIGFLAFWQKRAASGGDSRLFVGWRPHKYGNHATYPLRRFNETFLAEAIELNENQSFYSLRHTFRDALRRIDASPTVLKALGAWEHGSSISDHYGDQHDLTLQAKWIGAVQYPGLDLSFLYLDGGQAVPEVSA